MQTQGDGGGTTSQVCSVSPSDMAGQLDNIMDRLKALENAMAQLSTTNISAGQLSDISQSGGWLYDVTYMGIPGWTQTAAGTLIPPPGVTFSSLGILPESNVLVSYDENGNLIIGFTNTGSSTGVATGSSPTYWNAGGAASGSTSPDYGYSYYNAGWTGNQRGLTLTSRSVSTRFLSIIYTIATDGLYYVDGHHTSQKDTSTTNQITDQALIRKNADYVYKNFMDLEASNINQTRFHIGASGLVELSVGDTIEYKNNSGVFVDSVINAGMSVVRISD